MFKRFLILLLFMFPFSTSAHSPLASLSPQDGAFLSQAPAQIKMVFKSPTKLFKVEMLKITSDTNRSLLGKLFGNTEGDLVSLDEAFLMNTAEEHVIMLPILKSGKYSVAWRAMGEDGHVIKGDFSFQLIDK